ncbi:Toxin subunit YenA2 [Frankliniella fusca]|uniref:Toxin subunit YenA2 n=1 Tax=Frankliniella fusca TaxID=407009 RepID=A0AAE1H586_9NEOP|nr:Toxin subunit YenA2 [Frankliniella fusca]
MCRYGPGGSVPCDGSEADCSWNVQFKNVKYSCHNANKIFTRRILI